MSLKTRVIVAGIVAGVVLLGGAALVALGDNAAADQASEERAKLRASIEKYDAKFRADQKLVAASSIAHIVLPSERSASDANDAGALLATKLPYGDADDEHAEKAHAIPAAVLGKLEWSFEKLLRKSGPNVVDVTHVDTAWMKELARYDAWDLEEAPQVKALRPLDVRDMPMPTLSDARFWAEIRMLQVLQANDGDTFEAAGHELDELARLLVSTETFLGGLYAADVLRAERAAYDYAVSTSTAGRAVDTGSWTPPDTAAIEAFSRVNRAWWAYFSLHGDPKTIDTVASSSEMTAGRCQAIDNAATSLIAIEPVVGDLYADARAAIGRALASSTSLCRVHRVREAWNDKKQRALAAGVDAMCVPRDGDCVVMSIAAHIPGANRGFFDAMYAGAGDDVLETVYGHRP